ncbi:MAG: hypothetical protein KIT40_01790 [Nitrospira sp.]|nr:hypothetical protein [Nitrospira sp.]
MHRHTVSQNTLATDIITGLIDLDSKLGLADVSDFAELADRLRSLGRSEFCHLICFASITLGLHPSVEPVEAEAPALAKE